MLDIIKRRKQYNSYTPKQQQASILTERTLNLAARKRDLHKINKENSVFLRNLHETQPTYSRFQWRLHEQRNELYKKNVST